MKILFEHLNYILLLKTRKTDKIFNYSILHLGH